MYELSGKIQGLDCGFAVQGATLTLSIDEKQAAQKMFDEFHDCKKLSIKISKHRKKRSNDANKYFWHLCEELAKKLSNDGVIYTKDDIYLDAIRKVGVWADDEVAPEKVKWRCAAWHSIGTGWVTERVDFTADGKNEIIRFYYGSSRYNTKQMSRLIDNIVQDCKEQGIQTKTPEQLAKLKSLWGE